MLKYTILYKNGKTWNGKAAKIVDIPLVDCVVMAVTLTDSYTDRTHLYIPQRLGWGHLRPVWPLKGAPKVRTPNPNSKTKKQKAFDEAYEKWAATRRPEVYIWGSGHAEYSIQAYKKWLWEQKLANSSKFTSPVSPGDTIAYWASDSNELKWVTIKPDELIIKSAYDKDVALKDKDGFIPWNGGEMPVPGATIVDVKLRDGDVVRKPAKAFFWREFGVDDDIIAYKVYDETMEKFNAAVNALKESLQKNIDGLSAMCWESTWKKLYANNVPIKTTYTFWLGADGSISDEGIVDDK